MPDLVVRSLRKSFPQRGRRRIALDGVSLDVAAGSALAVVGPSGAGKSTLLRAIAGLDEQDSGHVRVGDREVTHLAPQQRRIAVVFQYDALIASMSVRQNLAFARRAAPARIDLDALASTFGIGPHLGRKPRELSGGERQRVAIARALLSAPDVLLLDEPLVHLDPPLRVRVRDEVVRLRAHFSGPTLYVTHDHAEAMAVGDELAVMIDGRLEQIGPPQAVYDAPRNVRVARFLGVPPMNLLETVEEAMGFGNAIVGIRPEHVVVGGGSVRGSITRRECLGSDAYLHVATAAGHVVARVRPDRTFHVGETVEMAFPREFIRLFDRASGELLG